MVETDSNKIISFKIIRFFKDKLTYYGLAYYFFIASALFIIGKLVDILQDSILVIELTGLTLATFVLMSQNSALKFKSIQSNLTPREVQSTIYSTAKELKWYLIDVGSNYAIAKRVGGSFPFSWEERITIKFKGKEILINSLCDPDSAMVPVFGKNKKNIKTFKRNIEKQQALIHEVSFDILNQEILI